MVPHTPVIPIIEDASLPAMFNPLYSSTRTSAIKVATMKITDNFCYAIIFLDVDGAVCFQINLQKVATEFLKELLNIFY